MLFLQITLLAVLLAAGGNEDAFREQISFHMIHISSFHNHSWAQNLGSGWLSELQILGWNSNSGSLIFLRPWSKGNFNNKEMTEIEKFFRMLHIKLPPLIRNHASEWKFEYPFEVQITGGCELHPGEGKAVFLQFAYQGVELLNFQNNSWLPSSKGDSRAQDMCGLLNQHHVANKITQRLLRDTCPRYLLGLFDAGKADLQRKVKPEAWLSTASNPGPDRQMLVCHVSGFHPKPIWVKWMRGEQVQQRTQQSGILPNADGTWYLQVFLQVEATETSGLYCRVRHSSLGGQDIILYLERHRSSRGWIIVAVMVPLVLLTALAFGLRKRWSHCEPPATLLPLE